MALALDCVALVADCRREQLLRAREPARRRLEGKPALAAVDRDSLGLGSQHVSHGNRVVDSIALGHGQNPRFCPSWPLAPSLGGGLIRLSQFTKNGRESVRPGWLSIQVL